MLLLQTRDQSHDMMVWCRAYENPSNWPPSYMSNSSSVADFWNTTSVENYFCERLSWNSQEKNWGDNRMLISESFKNLWTAHRAFQWTSKELHWCNTDELTSLYKFPWMGIATWGGRFSLWKDASKIHHAFWKAEASLWHQQSTQYHRSVGIKTQGLCCLYCSRTSLFCFICMQKEVVASDGIHSSSYTGYWSG